MPDLDRLTVELVGRADAIVGAFDPPSIEPARSIYLAAWNAETDTTKEPKP